MKGSVQWRNDLKKSWCYVSIYYEGKHHKIEHYRGQRMYHEAYAEKLLHEVQADIERGVFDIRKYKGRGHSDVIPYMQEWLELVGKDLAPGTEANYRGYIRNHLTPFFESNTIMLHEINHRVLMRLLNSLELQPKGKLNAMQCFHACLDYAWRAGDLISIPPFPKKKHYQLEDKAIECIPEDRQIAIIRAIPERHQPIFWFLKYHMRRPAEAMMLYKGDYDSRSGEFIIRRGISNGKEVEHTKTKKQHRIPCHSEFKVILDTMTTDNPFSPYIFTCKESNHPNKRYTRSIMERLWKEACKATGENIPLYNGLKHSSVQAYFDAGYSPEEVKTITDHASIESVKRYGNVRMAIKRNLLERRVINIRERTGNEIEATN